MSTFTSGFVIFPNLTQLDLTGPLQVLHRLPGARTEIVAKTAAPVPSDCGMSIVPTTTFAECPPLDFICVPGGFGVSAAIEDDATVAFVRERAAQARYVTSVCTGAFILGAAGLLHGKRATTHWAYHHLLPRVGAVPVWERVVRDERIITGGGVTAGIDFAFTVMGDIAGSSVAQARAADARIRPASTLRRRLAGPRIAGDQGFRGSTLRHALAPVHSAARSRISAPGVEWLNVCDVDGAGRGDFLSGAGTMVFRTVAIEGVRIFYREAGAADAPALLLLHGFPSSSHMYRDLMPKLADAFRVVAPDYPGYGFSDAPPIDRFHYTFDHVVDVIERFTECVGLAQYGLYMQDFGGPVGFRLAVRHPERIRGLIIQNAVAHIEGLAEDIHRPARRFWENRSPDTEQPMREFLTPDTTRFQYLHGARAPERVSPDGWTLDQALIDRPGSTEIQLEMLYDYRSNPPRYAEWQAYLREHHPPTLVVWGRNDPFFTVAGATAYIRDVPDAEVHLLSGGHFTLEEHAETISILIKAFWAQRRGQGSGADTTPETPRHDPAGFVSDMAGPTRRLDPIERAEIVDALYRFAAGQDLHDRVLFESAFSQDARVDFTGPARRLGVPVPIFQGRQHIADTILSATRDLDTTHTVTNARVTAYDGERARLSALVEAQHLPRGDHSRHLLLKNIYNVQLSKAGPHWVIDDMRIDNVWLTGDASVLFPT